MPNFDIVKTSEIDKTYRVARVMGDFDVQQDHCGEHFVGDIELPDAWNIGLIVGNSGTGKTTIARELFGEKLYEGGVLSAQVRHRRYAERSIG